MNKIVYWCNSCEWGGMDPIPDPDSTYHPPLLLCPDCSCEVEQLAADLAEAWRVRWRVELVLEHPQDVQLAITEFCHYLMDMPPKEEE